MEQKTIRSKQQFKYQLTAELGFLPGLPVKGGGNKLSIYYKPIVITDGKKGQAYILFQNVGSSFMGSQDLRIMIGVKLDNPEGWENMYDFLPTAYKKYLNKEIDPLLEGDIYIPDKSGLDANGINTLEKYQTLKGVIQEIEEKGYFATRLQDLYEEYQFGQKLKEDIKKRVPQLMPKFKNIIDKFDESKNIVFYTDAIKRKVTNDVICISYGNKAITICVGRGKIENAKLVINPKKTMHGYFYRNYPHYIYSHDVCNGVDSEGNKILSKLMWWKCQDLEVALEEIKKYVNEYI